jgi:hypothetical protein
MNALRLSPLVPFAVLALFSLVACTSEAGDDLEDENTGTSLSALDLGTDANEIGGLDRLDPAQAAADLAGRETNGCRTRTLDPAAPNVVHVTLTDCSGRFDKHVVNGHVTVTFSSNADGSLHIDKKSDDLTIDGRAFTRNVSANVSIAGTVRTISRHAEQVGTNKHGEGVVHEGDHIVVVDSATRCRTVNGTNHTVVNATRNIRTTMTNFQLCEAAAGEDFCPRGVVERVNESKAKTSVATFDGTPTVDIAITKPNVEKNKTWTLSCTAH